MKRFFTENLGLKITAVLLSVILWFFVTSRGQSEIAIETPLEFKNVPAEFDIASTSVKAVSVTVRGQERMIKNIRPSDIRVFVDLEKARNGETTLSISTEDVQLPYAVSVTSVMPNSVRVRLDKRVIKTVRIQPMLTGEMPQGLSVAAVSVQPRSVTVTGLKSELEKLRTLRTDPVDISELAASDSIETGIDRAGFSIEVEPATVKVQITVKRRGE